MEFEEYANKKIKLTQAVAKLEQLRAEEDKVRKERLYAQANAKREWHVLEPLHTEMNEAVDISYPAYMAANKRWQDAKREYAQRYGDPIELLERTDRGAFLIESGAFQNTFQQLEHEVTNLREEIGEYEKLQDQREDDKNQEVRNLMGEIEDLLNDDD